MAWDCRTTWRFAASQGQLVGILNGVDYDDWDPRWDRLLPRHFGPYELEIKAGLKKEFLSQTAAETDGHAPCC